MNHDGRSPLPSSRWIGLGLMALSLLSACQIAQRPPSPEAIAQPQTQPNSDRLTVLETKLAQQINQYRQAQNLPPILLSSYLSQEARIHSERIALGLIPFNSPDFEESKAAIANVIPFQALTVNLVQTAETPDLAAKILKTWVDNPQNRKNLEGNFDLFGIGIIQNAKGIYYITQIFLVKSPSPPTTVPNSPAQPSPKSPVSTRPNPSANLPDSLNNDLLSPLEQEIFKAVNQYRRSRQLPPLQFNARISAVARQHAQAMAKKQATFSHDGFDKRVKILKNAMPLRSVGENLAYIKGYPNLVETTVQGWIDSPGHRKTMEGNYNLTGIGIAKNLEGEYYFSQLFVLEP